MAKSKFFRVAVEGATTDGRTMERSWIQDIAANYSPNTYGARIFLEHLRGMLPEGPFKAYGDVTAVKAEEIATGDLKGKLALFAQIEPTPELVAMAKAKQKIYPSIEVNPKFADTGRAYLVGLGITDSPASLGTDMMQFAAGNPAISPFTARKQSPDNLFTAATEAVEIEFEDEPAPAVALFAQIKDRLAKLTTKAKSSDAQLADVAAAMDGLTAVVESFAERDTVLVTELSALKERLATVERNATTARTEFSTLRTQLGQTEATPRRPAATGGNGTAQTDC